MINSIKKNFTLADILLIIFLLSVAIFMIFLIKDDITSKFVEINYDNKFVDSIPLDKDRIINIDEGIVVEIKDGKVRVKESTCKNQFCVDQGWSNHFPIICVPNRLSVVIKNKKEEIIITK